MTAFIIVSLPLILGCSLVDSIFIAMNIIIQVNLNLNFLAIVYA